MTPRSGRYSYYWTNVYSPQEIKELKDALVPHFFTRDTESGAANIKKTSEVYLMKWHKVKHALEHFYDRCLFCNTENFGFNLYPVLNYHNIFYNIYKPGAEYEWHTDGIQSKNPVSVVKLTCVLNMSQGSYEGGALEVAISAPTEVPEFNHIGSMAVFPAFTPHRVKPVLKGVRESLVLWLVGPKFV